MSFMRMWFPLLILCIIDVGPVAAQKYSDIVMDFLSMLNGNWTNKPQIEAGSTEHDYMEARLQPVDVPALRPKNLLFMEYSVNGKLIFLYLAVVKQNHRNKNIVHLTPYNFTDASKYKPGEFNVDDLHNLTVNDLHHEPHCIYSYVWLGGGVFSGVCPVCESMVGKKHPAYGVTLTCDHITGAVPLAIHTVRTTSVPYVLRLAGPRYPLIYAPINYVSPCDKRTNTSANETQA